MEKELIKIIQFNEKVQEIFELDFYHYLRENRSLEICVGGKKNPGVRTSFPSKDSIRSFILLLRLLIRDGKEKISFYCLKQYYKDLPIPEEYHNTYRDLHDSLNAYLDSKTRTTYEKIPRLKNRKLLNVFLWSQYAHFDEKKEQTLSEWKKLVAYPDLYREFLSVLWEIMDYMEDIKTLNKKTITYLRK